MTWPDAYAGSYQNNRASAEHLHCNAYKLEGADRPQQASELGVNSYVVKPVMFRDFVAAVADLGILWAMLMSRHLGPREQRSSRPKHELSNRHNHWSAR